MVWRHKNQIQNLALHLFIDWENKIQENSLLLSSASRESQFKSIYISIKAKVSLICI